MPLEHESIIELLGAFAVNAVDIDERDEIERHLLECPRCRAEVDEHREVVALIANTGVDAPEGIWTRIESALIEPPPAFDLRVLGDRPSQDSPTHDVVAPSDEPMAPVVDLSSRRRSPMLLSAAAAVVALVVGLAVGSLVGGSDSNEPTVQVASSLDEAARAAMNESTAKRVSLVAADGERSVEAVVTDHGLGYLVGTTLEELDASFAYQLWGVRDGVAVSLGVLGPSPSVVAFPITSDFEALALTIERSGGVVSSAEPAAYVGAIA